MSAIGTATEGKAIAASLIAHMATEHGEAHPLTATGAMAMAMGAMVGSMASAGVTLPGRSGALIRDLAALAEAIATGGLEDIA